MLAQGVRRFRRVQATVMLGTGHHWLPFTQMNSPEAHLRRFVRGEGSWLYDDGGTRVFDAVSSIWTTIHGHCHPRIAEAIAKQAHLLDHATALGASNPLAEALAARLCTLTGMGHAIFASDGASAVETAVKIAIQYWQNVGQPQRNRIVRLRDAYHGDTVGAMSCSNIALFNQRFSALTFETLELEKVDLAAEDIAAVIVEPLVQAAAGMRTVSRHRYQPLAEMTPILICDEIATGFGRTGTMFAFEQAPIRPDLIVLGKGLTGGALALSATLATERIYDAFLGEYGEYKHLFHGHSYAGNPIACAAALASLALFDEERTLVNALSLSACIRRRLDSLRLHALVRDVRAVGTMVGIEVHADRIDAGGAISAAWRIADGLYRAGHFTRPIGDVIQLVPPLCAREEYIDAFFDALTAELGP